MKRKDYISWDEYFMGIAKLSAMRSKDPGTQVGACIVNDNNRVLSIGYNGLPTGCDDDEYPWERDEKDPLDNKYPYVVHAEMNAILNNRSGSLEGARIYVTLFPCNECAKAIIQSGIEKVIYCEDKYKDTDSVKASKRMFESAGITTRKLDLILEINSKVKSEEPKTNSKKRKTIIIYGISKEPSKYYFDIIRSEYPNECIVTHTLMCDLSLHLANCEYTTIYNQLVEKYGANSKFIFIEPEFGFIDAFKRANNLNKDEMEIYSMY